VSVHEARQHDAAAGIDDLRICRSQALDFRARSHFQDAPVASHQCAIRNDRQLAHLRAGARPRRPRQGDHLAAIDDDEITHNQF